MNRDSVDWSGPMPATITVFGRDGRIDPRGMAENVERLLAAGATGILFGGCTGEFWALTEAERAELFAIGAKVVNGRATVIAGTGAVTVDEALRLTDAAREAGCDGALILPPYFIRLDEDEIFEHFRAIDAQASLPIVLYNIPGNAGNAITPRLAERLADLEHVVAIKESSGDWNNFHATLIAVRDRLRVFCGPASLFAVPAQAAGADGVIDCFPNCWLPGGIDLWFAAVQGRHEEAEALQAMGRKLTELFTSEGRSLYPATKAAMRHSGYLAGDPRPPLQPLSGEALAGLEAGLDALNIK